jgi:hypothetical protein
MRIRGNGELNFRRLPITYSSKAFCNLPIMEADHSFAPRAPAHMYCDGVTLHYGAILAMQFEYRCDILTARLLFDWLYMTFIYSSLYAVQVKLKVNKLTSPKTHLGFENYKLKFCKVGLYV